MQRVVNHRIWSLSPKSANHAPCVHSARKSRHDVRPSRQHFLDLGLNSLGLEPTGNECGDPRFTEPLRRQIRLLECGIDRWDRNHVAQKAGDIIPRDIAAPPFPILNRLCDPRRWANSYNEFRRKEPPAPKRQRSFAPACAAQRIGLSGPIAAKRCQSFLAAGVQAASAIAFSRGKTRWLK